MDSAKNKKLYKSNTTQEHIYIGKKEIKSKMCSRIKKVQNSKMCKTSRMCKNSIWDLINSTINRRDERDVQTTGGMRGMCKRLFFFFMFIKQSLCLGA